MKQTIEIEVPEGKKAVWKDGKVVFEDIEPNLPKTWEEFCKNYPIKKGECFIDASSNILETAWTSRHIYGDRNKLNIKAAEQHLALMQLHQLRDCYRQGWKPDLADPKNIFAIFHNRDKYSVKNFVASNKFLSFQLEEIASKFLHNFKDLIKQAGDLI